MSFQDHTRCDRCSILFLNGTPHKCKIDSVDAARLGLEEWLVDYEIEAVDVY